MAKDLVAVAMFESQRQTRKFVKRDIKPDEDRGGERITDSFDRPIDDGIVKWLDQNALARVTTVRSPFRSDYPYLFNGSNGTLCAIYPELVTLDEGDVFVPGDQAYLWKIAVRYQPASSELPGELTEALSGLGFERKVS